jgi:hypothetical protein
VLEDDPTTLFTSSGMQPLVPFLLGEKHPLGDKLVDSQPSFRAEDMDEVGDNRPRRKMRLLKPLALLPLLSLTACYHGTVEIADSPALCRSWHPVTVSKHDRLTRQTAEEIAANNAAQEVWCSQPPKFASALVRA